MYSQKKKIDKRYLLILIVLALAIILVILSFALRKDRDLNPIEKFAQDTGTAILKVVSAPFNFVKEKIEEMQEKDNIYEKYKDLKNKEEQIDSIIAENENLESEIQKLKDTLELNTVLSDTVFLNATIVTRNIGYWYDEITIDKGSKNGVTKDMAVVTSKGLIGKVVKVSNYSSTVKLLSSDSFGDKVSVKIKSGDDYIYGLITSYDKETNTYAVEGISENVDIEKGATVVTTGMSDVFPSGIQVGTVKGFTTDNFDLSKLVEVEASVNYDDIDYVTILKRKDS